MFCHDADGKLLPTYPTLGSATGVPESVVMRVGCLQTGLAGFDADVLAEVLARCGRESVDLLVFPECYVGGLPRTESAALAVAIEDPYVELVSIFEGCPSTTTVVAGFTERGNCGVVYSSAAVLRGGGVLGVSRKLFPIERVFTPGQNLPVYPTHVLDASLVLPATLRPPSGTRHSQGAPSPPHNGPRNGEHSRERVRRSETRRSRGSCWFRSSQR
jgi:hypothetical protein